MPERLSVRIAASFLLFAVIGTLGLLLLLRATYQRLSRSEFQALANANAEFIRTEHLPQTERLALYLSRMLGVAVRFQRLSAVDAHHEAVAAEVEPGVDLTLIRERPTFSSLLLRPVTVAALIGFWVMWFALARAVARPYLRAQRLALLGGMATALAHEIRNPIAAIRLHGQLLTGAHPEEAKLIVDEAAKIEDLVNQWMFLARPEPPHKSEVAVADLLAQTVRVLGPMAQHAQVQIILNTVHAQHIQADARRLAQVFHNVIHNAIQAMPKGGCLTITTGNGKIRFADTGPGFSPMALTRWAEMLYSEKEGGMGIGLSVAQEIVLAHGGRITVGNRVEGGACVDIEL